MGSPPRTLPPWRELEDCDGCASWANGDYVGGQLCRTAMCQPPAVAMYRSSPPLSTPAKLYFIILLPG